MKKLLLLITLFLFLGCEKEEVVLEQVFEISLDGESFNPYERYAKVETFGENQKKTTFGLSPPSPSSPQCAGVVRP